MILYRIYTEDKNRDIIEKILNKSMIAYTILRGTGVWNSVKESFLVVQFFSADKQDENIVSFVCAEIKRVNQQECVTYTKTDLDVRKVE